MSDHKALKSALESIDPKRRTIAFYLVKEVVKRWGHWKDLPRGKPLKFK